MFASFEICYKKCVIGFVPRDGGHVWICPVKDAMTGPFLGGKINPEETKESIRKRFYEHCRKVSLREDRGDVPDNCPHLFEHSIAARMNHLVL